MFRSLILEEFVVETYAEGVRGQEDPKRGLGASRTAASAMGIVLKTSRISKTRKNSPEIFEGKNGDKICIEHSPLEEPDIEAHSIFTKTGNSYKIQFFQ